jgi:hypothetical protein
MDLLGTPIFTIGAVDLKGDEGRKKVEEFIKNVDEKIRIIVANDANLMQRFNDELNIIANKGFHFTLARRCAVPASREMEFMTANICESFGNCSFYLADKAPVGCACPFEIMYIKQLTEGFIESTNIDPENSFLDMQSLTEYVTYSLNFFSKILFLFVIVSFRKKFFFKFLNSFIREIQKIKRFAQVFIIKSYLFKFF